MQRVIGTYGYGQTKLCNIYILLVRSYSEQHMWPAMSYGDLRRATEGYGELWIPAIAKTKLYNIDTLLVKSYGELQIAK